VVDERRPRRRLRPRGRRDRVPRLAVTLAVLQPGRPSGVHHRESNQEDFLVLAGECLLIVEGEERTLRAWDFVHCPPETEHVFVRAGDGPCAILMTGARNGWPDHTGIVNALGGRAAARRRGRERDDERGGGLRPLPPPAPRTNRGLGRTPLGVSQGRD
jgi:quercetin dioxygenase-like cupin family protein